jgi:hypothetical protein
MLNNESITRITSATNLHKQTQQSKETTPGQYVALILFCVLIAFLFSARDNQENIRYTKPETKQKG